MEKAYKEKKVSLILPCYRAEFFLPYIIDDIIKQTYIYWELLVVSNGNHQEAQLRVANEYAKNDQRIKVLTTAEAGVSKARNLGMRIAQGDYICFVDADDRLNPNHLELLCSAMDDDVDVVEGGYEMFDINGRHVVTEYPNRVFDLAIGDDNKYVLDVSEVMVILNKPNYPTNKLFRRSFLKEKELFFNEKYTMIEDGIFIMSVFLNARKWKCIPFTGYILKASRGSAMSRWHDKYEEAWEICLSKKNQVKSRIGYTPKMIDDEYIAMKYNLIWQYIWNMFKPGCPLNFYEKIVSIDEMLNDKDFKASIAMHDWKHERLRYKLFYLCVKTRSSLIVAMLFLFQHHGKQFLNKIKGR